MPIIHPSAIVDSKAEIADDVVIGPFCIVESNVVIQSGTRIIASAYIASGARIGQNCTIYPGAVIAAAPQDLKYRGEETLAIVGDRTVVRECVTIHRGTKASGKTEIGSECLLMAYTHVAHDCTIGNQVIIANATQLGGHVHIGDAAVLGGVSLVHQFCRIGRLVITGAGTKVTKDVPPFLLINGNKARIYGPNRIGLRRKGFTHQQIDEITRFYKVIFQNGMNVSDGIRYYIDHYPLTPEVQECIDFIQNSTRGVYLWRVFQEENVQSTEGDTDEWDH